MNSSSLVLSALVIGKLFSKCLNPYEEKDEREISKRDRQTDKRERDGQIERFDKRRTREVTEDVLNLKKSVTMREEFTAMYP